MPATHFEPLRAMDRQFLAMENENAHMHVSGFSTYELEPLRAETGGIDFETFRNAIEAALERIPRYRQRLAYTPIDRRPVWVDAADFELDFHLRHVSLPPPGSDDQLKQMTGWIVGQPLDRTRPLWEMLVVEGLEGGKYFAVVTKMHHCMLDAGAGVNLMQLLLRAEPGYEIPVAKPFEPRPAPSRAELAAYEVGRRLRTPLNALGGLRRFAADNASLVGALVERIGAIRELTRNLRPASPTPINGALGPHRRIDWLSMPLGELSTLRHELGCSLNDLVLAIVAGALRRYLGRLSVELEGLDFRVSIPVNVRREPERDEMGNRVSSWIVPMPLAEADPLAQLKAIRLRTARLKRSHQAVAVEMLMAAADELPRLVPLIAGALQGQISMIVTNVPGPPIPLYLLGCRTLEMQPLVPLFPGVGIGLALLSYNGTLSWGFLGDYDLVPDLDRFVDDVREARGALEVAARRRSRPVPES